MKKFFIFLSILVGIIVVAALVIGAIEPTDIIVKRSALIKAPKEAVFEQMVLFKNWPNWSPWYKMEPTAKIVYEGIDGEPGSSYRWAGGKKTGAGMMSNSGVKGTEMNFDVLFTKPRKGKAHGILSADDTAGMTKATWSFSMHMPYPMNAMCLFMDMDKMLGGDFESGLNNMKQYLESQGPAIEIKEMMYPAHVFAGARQVVFWNEMDSFFMKSFKTMGKELGSKINGPAGGLFFDWDTVNKRADMAAVFPVSDTLKLGKGIAVFQAGPSRAYMAVQKGGYSSSMRFHAALAKRAASNGQTVTNKIEEYVVSPGQEPDSNKWVTNIYYLVK
jgi:hypothetical protein